ncbi:MAG: cytochrome d ubiquinol oxidase subunit II [Actinomycetota bacterium]
MSLADVVAVTMFAGIVAYAILGGADFGSGVWDLLAGRDERSGDRRRLIDHAIGPVWEANHVWLIFVIVFLWTGFPDAFGSIMRTLYVPFWFVGLGIVLRGAGFAFRKYSATFGEARVYGIAFASSSLITPFFLGAIAGAVASGRVPADGVGDRWTSWLGPTSLLGGVLAVLTCAFLAAVFLAAEADSLGRDDLREWFRRRALITGVITGAVAVAGIVPLATDAETLFDGLTGRGLVEVVGSAVGGALSLWFLRTGQLRRARVAAVVAVGAVVAGWGFGQYPWLLVDEVEIADAAGADATLWGLVIGGLVAVALVVPSLVYLFVLADRDDIGSDVTSG